MGGLLEAPVLRQVADESERGHGKFRYSAVSMQGWRVTQEDTHVAQLSFGGHPGRALFCIFDGHGGEEMSRFCKKYLPLVLREELAREVPSDLSPKSPSYHVANNTALETSVTRMDSLFQERGGGLP